MPDWDNESNNETLTFSDFSYTTQGSRNIGVSASGMQDMWSTMRTTNIISPTPDSHIEHSHIELSTTCFSWKSIFKIAFGWYFFPFIIVFAKIFKKEIRI